MSEWQLDTFMLSFREFLEAYWDITPEEDFQGRKEYEKKEKERKNKKSYYTKEFLKKQKEIDKPHPKEPEEEIPF